MFHNDILISPTYFSDLVSGLVTIPDDILESLSTLIHENKHMLNV